MMPSSGISELNVPIVFCIFHSIQVVPGNLGVKITVLKATFHCQQNHQELISIIFAF